MTAFPGPVDSNSSRITPAPLPNALSSSASSTRWLYELIWFYRSSLGLPRLRLFPFTAGGTMRHCASQFPLKTLPG